MADLSMVNDVQKILEESRRHAIKRGVGYIDTECLLLGLIHFDNPTTPLFETLNFENISFWIDHFLDGAIKIDLPDDLDLIPLTVEAEQVIRLCMRYASQAGTDYASGIHLLLAMVTFHNHASVILSKEGLTFEDCIKFATENKLLHRPISRKKKYVLRGKNPLFLMGYTYYSILTPIKAHREAFVKQLYSLGVKLYHEKEYRSALRLLGSLLRIINDHYSALVLRGLIYLKLKEYLEATKYLKRAIEVHSEKATAFVNLGLVMSAMNLHDDALSYYAEALKRDPNDALVLNNIGFSKLKKGDIVGAKAALEKAIEIDKFLATAYNNLGYANYKQNRLELAMENINKSLSMDKSNSYAYKNRALVNIALSKRELACRDLHFAEKYGFTEDYGDEVIHLKQTHC